MSFRIGNCKVTVSFFFFAVLCICSMSDFGHMTLYGMLAAFLHELGHLFTAFMFGLFPDSVSVGSAGFIMHIPELDVNRKVQILTALSGGAVNLVLFSVSAFFCREFAAANLALCILSLLPCDPFDGGIIIRSILEKFLSDRKADLIVLFLTILFLAVLVFFGVLVLLRSRYNFSLLILSMLIFTTICQRTLK